MSLDRIDTTLAGISTDRKVRYENYQALALVQALLGSITPNMIAIAMRCVGEGVHLHFYLERQSASDREEIDDIETAFCALQFTAVPTFVHVAICDKRFDARAIDGRMVYLRSGSIGHRTSNPVSGATGDLDRPQAVS